MNQDDPFIRVSFPSGTTFAIRFDCSGVVCDERRRPIDEVLAADMLHIKSWKLIVAEVRGRG